MLTSPVDGVVAERRTDVGERLGEGTVAFVVEQTAPLKLRFRVPERYLAAVKVGQAVKATVDPYPGTEFEGTLSLVGGSVDAATRTFLAEAEFPNRDRRLRPGPLRPGRARHQGRLSHAEAGRDLRPAPGLR